MTKNPTFIRKVIYLCCIAALLLPISWISRPATSDRDDGRSDAGGKLSQLRTEYGLSQAELGEIDPASSTMQLATLGLRGPAATLLWNRAIDFQKKENWDGLSATLNQIAKIQPHMISVWKFQAWNIAYNVSVEFDDYEMRYHWVKKGVDFMLKGTRYNAQSPRLLNDLGWFFSHKFGRSDEYRQFRREFKIDKEFHKTLPFETPEWQQVESRSPDNKPDNWLVSWLWHLRAEEAASISNHKNLGANHLVFYARAPMALMYFAPAIQEDGIDEEIARRAWRQAGEAWKDYGDMSLPTSLGDVIQLNNLANLNSQIEVLEARLEALAPGVEDALLAELKDGLEPAEREAFETPWGERDGDQYELAARAERKLEYSPHEIAERAPADSREEALQIADQLAQKKIEAIYTNRYRMQINYPYWQTRATIEQSEEAVTARKNVYDAEQLYREADLVNARAAYESAWRLWAGIFDEYPEMLEDTTAEDLMESVERYSVLLGQLEVSFPPEDFPLMDLLQVQDPEFKPAAAENEATEEGAEDETEPRASAAEDATAAEETATPTEGEESPESSADTGDDESSADDAPAAEPASEPAESAESAEELAPADEGEPETAPAEEATQSPAAPEQTETAPAD